MEESNPFKRSTKIGRLLKKQKRGWNVMLRKRKKMREKFKVGKGNKKVDGGSKRDEETDEGSEKGVRGGEEKIGKKNKEVGGKIVRK